MRRRLPSGAVAPICLWGRLARYDGFCVDCNKKFGDKAWAETRPALPRKPAPQTLSDPTFREWDERIAIGSHVTWIGHYGRPYAGTVERFDVEGYYRVRVSPERIYGCCRRPLERDNPNAPRVCVPFERRPSRHPHKHALAVGRHSLREVNDDSTG